MSKLTAVTAALLILLAGYGIAGASVLTLTVEVSTTNPTPGDSVTYTVYGQVTGNTTTDGFGTNLDGGLHQFTIDQVYTGTADVSHKPLVPNPASPAGKTALTANNALFTSLVIQGTTVDDAWVPTYGGTGGVDNTFGAKGLPGQYDYYGDQTALKYGNGAPIALFSGTIQTSAASTGTAIITFAPPAGDSLCRIYVINPTSTALEAVAPTTIVPAVVQLTIGVVPPTPTLTGPGGSASVTEADWTGPDGWNNPLRSVQIAADPAGTYDWTLFAPSGASTVIAAATASPLTLTIGMIQASPLAGELQPNGALMATNPELYTWSLSAGGGAGAQAGDFQVFVPEPATMALLSFGVIGALLKRRRA